MSGLLKVNLQKIPEKSQRLCCQMCQDFATKVRAVLKKIIKNYELYYYLAPNRKGSEGVKRKSQFSQIESNLDFLKCAPPFSKRGEEKKRFSSCAGVLNPQWN